jgi:hypothetical protein
VLIFLCLCAEFVFHFSNRVRSGHLVIVDSLLAGNEAGGSGGGMAAAGFADSEIVGTNVTGNSAALSGGGFGLSQVHACK